MGGFGEITEFDYQSDIKTFMLEGLRLIDAAGLDFPQLTEDVDAYLDNSAIPGTPYLTICATSNS